MRTFSTKDQWVVQAKNKHGDLYDYTLVEYVDHKTPVMILCKQHGEFLQKPYVHTLNGSGCSKCYRERMYGRYNLSTETFINKARNKHGDLYDYSEVDYINNKTKVTILCPSHGKFAQSPASHLRGTRCPLCAKKQSKGEQKIGKFLIDHHIPFIKEYKFPDCINPETLRALPYDFFLPNLNTLIEFDGEHHYFPVIFSNNKQDLDYFTKCHEQIKHNDAIKSEYATKKGIQLIRIPYFDSVVDHLMTLTQRKPFQVKKTS